MDNQHIIENVAQLEALYGQPMGNSVSKEIDYVHPLYARMIEAAPFVALATAGDDGLDVSPRGDAAGFVVVENEKTLLMPDRRGNNRVDSLRNVIADPRVALLFLIPGIGETLRVNGRAYVSVDPALLDRFIVDQHVPKSVLVVQVECVFFQCSRAIVRSHLWDSHAQIERGSLPSPGAILAALTANQVNGNEYDRDLPERVAKTLY